MKTTITTKVDTAGLIAKAQAGDTAARNALVAAYLPLVRSITAGLAKRAGRMDLHEDLIQLATVGAAESGTPGGVLRGIELFDVTRCTDGNVESLFASFIGQWIRHESRAALANAAGLNRGPMGRARTIRRARAKLYAESGVEPSQDAILAAVRGAKGRPIRPADVASALAGPAIEISYDQAMAADSSLKHELELVSGHATEEEFNSEADTAEQVEACWDAMMTQLNPKERDVLRRYYGLRGVGGPRETDAQIAVGLGVSPRQVKHVRQTALGKLRGSIPLQLKSDRPPEVPSLARAMVQEALDSANCPVLGHTLAGLALACGLPEITVCRVLDALVTAGDVTEHEHHSDGSKDTYRPARAAAPMAIAA